MATPVLKHRFTVAEYLQMARAGVFGPAERVERIDREIIDPTPIGSEHQAAVDLQNGRLAPLLGERAIVRVQDSVWLTPRSLRQPDLAVLRPRRDVCRHRHPAPEDIPVVVDVATRRSRTIAASRSASLPAWASPRHGSPVLPRDTIEVPMTPTPAGYRDMRTFGRSFPVSPGPFPAVELSVDEIVG